MPATEGASSAGFATTVQPAATPAPLSREHGGGKFEVIAATTPMNPHDHDLASGLRRNDLAVRAPRFLREPRCERRGVVDLPGFRAGFPVGVMRRAGACRDERAARGCAHDRRRSRAIRESAMAASAARRARPLRRRRDFGRTRELAIFHGERDAPPRRSTFRRRCDREGSRQE